MLPTNLFYFRTIICFFLVKEEPVDEFESSLNESSIAFEDNQTEISGMSLVSLRKQIFNTTPCAIINFTSYIIDEADPLSNKKRKKKKKKKLKTEDDSIIGLVCLRCYFSRCTFFLVIVDLYCGLFQKMLITR